MAISSRLKTFLDAQGVAFKSHKHPVAYTAQEIAASLHVSGRQLAKCVFVKTDRGAHLAVLPAAQLVDLKRLKALLGAKTLSLGREPDIKQHFPDVEVGAMSVFGNLYGVPTVVDKSLAEAGEIVCNAGTHTETITIRYADFARLATPKAGSFGLVASGGKGKPAKKPRKASKKPPKGRARKAPRKAKKTRR